LFLHAAAWSIVGLWLLVFPRSFVTVFSPGYFPDTHFGLSGGTILVPVNGPAISVTRFLGVAQIGLAMFMVLVAQKIEAVWWWSWAFVITDALLALVVVLHLAAGLPTSSAALPWWLAVVVALAFSVGVLWGLFRAQQDQPIIET
jgi:hypothetical protein